MEILRLLTTSVADLGREEVKDFFHWLEDEGIETYGRERLFDVLEKVWGGESAEPFAGEEGGSNLSFSSALVASGVLSSSALVQVVRRCRERGELARVLLVEAEIIQKWEATKRAEEQLWSRYFQHLQGGEKAELPTLSHPHLLPYFLLRRKHLTREQWWECGQRAVQELGGIFPQGPRLVRVDARDFCEDLPESREFARFWGLFAVDLDEFSSIEGGEALDLVSSRAHGDFAAPVEVQDCSQEETQLQVVPSVKRQIEDKGGDFRSQGLLASSEEETEVVGNALEQVLSQPPEEGIALPSKISVEMQETEKLPQTDWFSPEEMERLRQGEERRRGAQLEALLQRLQQVERRLAELVERIGERERSSEREGRLASDAEDLSPSGEAKGAEVEMERELLLEGKTYRVLSEQEFLEGLQEQKSPHFYGVYLASLRIPEEYRGKKIRFLHSYIRNIRLEGLEFEGELEFSNCIFGHKVSWKGSTFRKKLIAKRAHFLEGADFSQCQFHGEVNMNGATFGRYVSFRSCSFKKRGVFAKCRFEGGASFEQAEFEDEASFTESISKYRFTFLKTKFGKTVRFSNGEFLDICDFSKCHFEGGVNFIRSQFLGPVKFSDVRFLRGAEFKGGYFAKDVFFSRAHFAGVLNFSGVQGEANFFFQQLRLDPSTSYILSHIHISRIFIQRNYLEGHIHAQREGDYLQAKVDYGLLKNNFRQINAYADEDWAYYMEKRMGRMAIEMSWRRPHLALVRFLDWLVLDLGCGYGTKPLNILGASLAIIAFFAGVYMMFPEAFTTGEVSGEHFDVVAALITSFKVFVGSEVGQWYPRFSYTWMSVLLMLESFLGLFIVTVLVVTFSRKVIR